MFQIGNIVTATNDSISYRLNDPKLSAFFCGYAYSSEKKLTGGRYKVINTFDEEITKDGTTEVTHYVVTLLATCGSMMRKNVCALLKPRAPAASYCPLGIDSMPPRNISAKYAA